MKLLALTPLLVSSAFAGTITLKGISNIGKSPDFIELPVTIQTKCFKEAAISNKVVDDAAKRVRDEIKKHINLPDGDQLVSTKGMSSRRDERISVYDANLDRNVSKLICEKGWRSSREIIARFSNLRAFEAINPNLIEIADELGQRVFENNESVSMTIGRPVPRLMPETRDAMEKQALKEALIDASDKFQIVKEVCSLVNVSLTGLDNASPVVRAYRDAGIPDQSLSFELQYVHLAWNVTWNFENTGGVCEESLLP